MGTIIKIPRVVSEKVDHITEEEMYKRFNGIHSWLSDRYGIIEVYFFEEETTEYVDYFKKILEEAKIDNC